MPNTLNVEIFESIGGWGFRFNDLVEQSRGFNGNEIVVPINSYGGDVFEGFTIYNYLKGHPAKVSVIVMGYAMSMGTVIAMAADEVIMPENGYFMIHNPWGVTVGDQRDHDNSSELLEKITDQIAKTYMNKTGLSRSKIRAMMDKETWLTGKEAKQFGFVDKLVDAPTYKASFEPENEIIDKCKNIPDEIRATKKKNMPKSNFFQTMAAKFGFGEDATEEQVTSKVDEVLNASQEQTQFEDRVKSIEDSIEKLTSIEESIKDAIDAEGVKAIVTEVLNESELTKDSDTKELEGKLTEAQKTIKDLADKVNDLKGIKTEETNTAAPQIETETERKFRATVSAKEAAEELKKYRENKKK